MSNYPQITFCSGVGTVTGANFLLETGESKVLIDCGMIQGEKFAMEENSRPFPYDVNSIDALIITHAHLDHVGRIPKLVKEGYSGPIYSTSETKALAEIVLNDAVGILHINARQEGVDPIYGADDVARVFPLWKTINYHEDFKVTDDISIFLKDAGHILGSAMVEVSVIPTKTAIQGEIMKLNAGGNTPDSRRSLFSTPIKGENNRELKILFTGDLGNSPSPLLRDTESVGEVDYIIMESVYGDRNHETRDERLRQFEKIIKDSIARGGTLIIPAFSIDRTQTLLYELNGLVEQKLIPSVPVFVDSPMAIKATQIYQSGTALFNDYVRGQIQKGDNVFDFPHLEYTVSQNESHDIGRLMGSKIILAGSGMSVGGRVISHEEYYLPDAKNTILLVGYQTLGSLGRQLADGARKVNIHGNKINIKARIETLYGYSAHKDSDHLVEFVSTATNRLKQIFVVMGEPGASMHLAQRINDELGKKALVPEREVKYGL
ncbi:MAG: MBL fold metallo-hydrolase [Patescibacteria group bacterium]